MEPGSRMKSKTTTGKPGFRSGGWTRFQFLDPVPVLGSDSGFTWTRFRFQANQPIYVILSIVKLHLIISYQHLWPVFMLSYIRLVLKLWHCMALYGIQCHTMTYSAIKKYYQKLNLITIGKFFDLVFL